MGGTRGRIYIKHADLFKVKLVSISPSQRSATSCCKHHDDQWLTGCVSGTPGWYFDCVCFCQYAADAKDKQWLAERNHMRATGGKMVRTQDIPAQCKNVCTWPDRIWTLCVCVFRHTCSLRKTFRIWLVVTSTGECDVVWFFDSQDGSWEYVAKLTAVCVHEGTAQTSGWTSWSPLVFLCGWWRRCREPWRPRETLTSNTHTSYIQRSNAGHMTSSTCHVILGSVFNIFLIKKLWLWNMFVF